MASRLVRQIQTPRIFNATGQNPSFENESLRETAFRTYVRRTAVHIRSQMRLKTMANKENGRQGSQGGSKNPGNFANDRQKASEAGRKGGQSSGSNMDHDRESGRKGGRT